MSLTRRVSIKWSDGPEEEPTDTLVITSLEKHYVDIRALAGSSPHHQQHDFPFDWAFCGQVVEGEDSQFTYTHDIDSRRLQGTGKEEIDSGKVEVLANGDERETGHMFNPATDKVEPFVEVWRPLDPNKSTLTPQPKNLASDLVVIVVATVDGQGANGKLVRVGNWMQGIVEFENDDKNNTLAEKLSVVRATCTGDIWSRSISWGNHVEKIPVTDLEGHVLGDTFTFGGIEWAVIEHKGPVKLL